MFAESNSRFLCEVSRQHATEFEQLLGDAPFGRVGEVRENSRVQIYGNSSSEALIDVDIAIAKKAWQTGSV
jgi:hypothetical protein